MHPTYTALRKYADGRILTYLCLLICVTLPAYTSAGSFPPDNGNNDTPDSVASKMPESYWGPLRLRILPPDAIIANDPIRFTVQCSKPAVRLGESFDLTITAELLNISPNLLFFQSGSNAYTLKMLLPPGFEQTGGDFDNSVTGELSYPSRPLMTYRISGHFRTVIPGTSFRLLRGQGQAGHSDQDLFVEKAAIALRTQPGETAISRPSTRTGSVTTSLYVQTDNVSSAGAARAEAAS